VKRYVVIKKNPIFDLAVGHLAGPDQIPTKQDKYKPLVGFQGVMKGEDGKDIVLDELYVRNPDKDAVQRFEKSFRELLKENIDETYPIKHPQTVEVVLHISVQQKRFFEVDVDNLAKTVLDCLPGLVLDDDSQVVNLLVQKDIHPFNIPGIVLALRKINKNEDSMFNDIKIYYSEETDEKPDEKK
jgi:Holliday junction resolvase RusA-like endonuclease